MTDRIAIRRLDVGPLDIPLHAPFGIAGGAQDVARNVLVEIELADGTRGLGEAAPFPAYNGETQAQALATLTAARTWVA
ncbi:MAG: dipeptide epimerase, partial [Burkholderiales bacterium]|nr:dipeptide epimerase [Opitutaceae bacterium]